MADTPTPLRVIEPPAYITDIPATLRALADTLQQEAADYGPGYVCRVTVVVRSSGKEPTVYGYGDNPPAQAFLDLHAGAHQLLMMKSPGRD